MEQDVDLEPLFFGAVFLSQFTRDLFIGLENFKLLFKYGFKFVYEKSAFFDLNSHAGSFDY